MIDLKIRRARRLKHRLIVAACLCLTWAATQTSQAQPAPDGPRSSRDFRWGLVAYHVALPGYALTPADIDRMADAGIGWLSIDLAWNAVQPTPGAALNFSTLDPIIDAAHRRGLKVVGKLGAGYNGNRPIAPPWTRDLDEARYLAALGAYAEATARHFFGRVHTFALENEFNIPNVHALIGWRVGVWTPEFMDRVMQVLSGAVHREAPDAEIMISITPLAAYESGIARMNRLIDYDSIGVHTYPVGFIPDLSLTDNIKDQIARAQRAGAGRPVVILETGMHTEAPPWTERLQADYLEAVSKASREAGAKGIFFWVYGFNG